MPAHSIVDTEAGLFETNPGMRRPDTYAGGIDDRDAGGEFAEVGAADKIGDEGVDGKRAQ